MHINAQALCVEIPDKKRLIKPQQIWHGVCKTSRMQNPSLKHVPKIFINSRPQNDRSPGSTHPILRLGLSVAAVLLWTDFIPADDGTQQHDVPMAVPFLEDIILTPDAFNLTFTPDGRTLYFSRANVDYSRADIWYAALGEEGWSEPRKAPFSSESADFDAFITSDGSKFFFVSNRSLDDADRPKGSFDIWMMEKRGEEWGEPHNLGERVNSDQNDGFLSLAANGNLYFCSDRSGGHGNYDIYVSEFRDGVYQDARNLGEPINSALMDTDPLISADESFLIFTRGHDIHISFKLEGEWTEPQPLGPGVNTGSTHDFAPALSRDGQTFYFTRQEGWSGPRRIFEIDARMIGIPDLNHFSE